MTVEDSDPDDRRDESSDEHDEAVDDANSDDEGSDAVDDDGSTDVPIDDSSSSDESPPDEPAVDEEGTDRRPNDRESDESRIGVSVSGTDASPEPDDPEADEGGHWLSSLLSALESLDSGSTSGRRRTDRTVLDYDISVRSGDDITDESRFERTSFIDTGSDDRSRRSEGDTGRPRKRRRRSSSSAGHLTTRRHDDELLVTADVAGTDPDDVTVGFDDSTLVVAVSGSELDRVDVPWRDRAAEATIKNGILTVLIERASDEGANAEIDGDNDDGGDDDE